MYSIFIAPLHAVLQIDWHWQKQSNFWYFDFYTRIDSLFEIWQFTLPVTSMFHISSENEMRELPNSPRVFIIEMVRNGEFWEILQGNSFGNGIVSALWMGVPLTWVDWFDSLRSHHAASPSIFSFFSFVALISLPSLIVIYSNSFFACRNCPLHSQFSISDADGLSRPQFLVGCCICSFFVCVTASVRNAFYRRFPPLT